MSDRKNSDTWDSWPDASDLLNTYMNIKLLDITQIRYLLDTGLF